MSDDMNRTPENPEDCEAQQRDARSADVWHTPPIINGLVAALEELGRDRVASDTVAAYGPVSSEDDVAFLVRLANVMRQTGMNRTELITIAGAYGMSLLDLVAFAEELSMLIAIIAQPIASPFPELVIPQVRLGMSLLADATNEESDDIDPDALAWHSDHLAHNTWGDSRSITSERSEQDRQTPPVIPLPIRSVEDDEPGPITFNPVTTPGGLGDIARRVTDQSRGMFDSLADHRLKQRAARIAQMREGRLFQPVHQIDAAEADRMEARTNDWRRNPYGTTDFREQPLTDFDPELFDPNTGRETARRRAHLRLVNEDSHALPGFDPFRAYTKRMLGHGMALTALMALGNFQETTAGTTDDTPGQNPDTPFDPAS